MKPLPEHLVRWGKPRVCHKCSALLPRKIDTAYRGSRPYCAGCVTLCKSAGCGRRRSATYKGLCSPCGRARQHEQTGEKRCKKCAAAMVRGASRSYLCAACRVSDAESSKRGEVKKKLARKNRSCRACGIFMGVNRRLLCDTCRDHRQVVRGRTNAKIMKQKRRAAMHGVRFEFSESAWKQLLEFFGNRCAYCGSASGKLEKDHVVPISKGGDHTADNIVPACAPCNRKKNDRSLIAFLAGSARSTAGGTN